MSAPEPPPLTGRERRELFDALTPEHIEGALTEALRRHDVDAVPGLLRLLAVRAPDRAQLVLEAIDLAAAIRDREAAG